MSVVRHGMVGRWSAVAGGVVALSLLPAVVGHWPAARAQVDVAALREKILASAARPYQGYVDSQGHIGLPDIPQIGDVGGLFGGSTSIRVWYASTHAWRAAIVEPTGEHDVYRTTAATYVWDFGRNLLTEVVGDLPVRLPWAQDVVPPELGRKLLAGAAAGDTVRAIGSRRVAGVSAAGLRLTPTDPDTTVGSVDIWADPATGLPVRVEVRPRTGGDPVFTSGFLDLVQRAPGADVLIPRWAITSGFTETRQPDLAAAVNATAKARLPGALDGRARVADPGGVTGVGAYGEGLSRFVVIPLPERVGQQSYEAFRKAAGGAPLADGLDGYAIQTGVLTAVVVRTPTERKCQRVYLLAGLLDPKPLSRAAAELTAVRR